MAVESGLLNVMRFAPNAYVHRLMRGGRGLAKSFVIVRNFNSAAKETILW
jgi:hypothetical protein